MTDLRRNPRSPVHDYQRKHWGVPATTAYKVSHPALPAGYEVPELGKLLELRVRGKTGGKAGSNRMRLVRIEPTQPAQLAYSPDKVSRLFCLLRPEDNAELARDYGQDATWQSLNAIHRERGGRQAQWPYAVDVTVTILGILHAVVYHTNKGSYEPGEDPDGPSNYVHEMGTEGDEDPVKPLLCMDQRGYLYLAGGSYIVEDRGIVN